MAKPYRPLAPSILNLILAFLLAAALIIPWTLGRAVRTVWRGEGN